MKTISTKKSTLLLVTALTFAASTMWSGAAMANEIVSGDFSTMTNWLTGTSQHNMSNITTVGGDSTCLTGTVSPSLQFNEFQYVDAAKLSDGSANPGWIAGAASETFTFSFQYYIGSIRPVGVTDVILYSYNPTTVAGPPRTGSSYQYAPGSTQNPLSNFTQLYKLDLAGAAATNGWVTVNVPLTTITGANLDPEWFAVYIDEKGGSGGAAFDTFSLDTQSAAPVPEPGTMVLLGAGMLGLALYGKRRMKKQA